MQPSISLTPSERWAWFFSGANEIGMGVYEGPGVRLRVIAVTYQPTRMLDLTRRSADVEVYRAINQATLANPVMSDWKTSRDAYAFLRRMGYDALTVRLDDDMGGEWGIDLEEMVDVRIFAPLPLATQVEDPSDL